MLLQALVSNVTELALQLVLVLLGSRKNTGGCCPGEVLWRRLHLEGGKQHVASRYGSSWSHTNCGASVPLLSSGSGGAPQIAMRQR